MCVNKYEQLVDLTRLLAMGSLVFLFRLHSPKKLARRLLDGDDVVAVVVVVDDAAPLSVATFPSLSQSSILPILIAIESLSVDTRLP